MCWFWFCQNFDGHFIGVHLHYAIYNVGGMLPFGFNTGKMFGVIENSTISDNRYDGTLFGAGVSYGYHWNLGSRWGLEATLGIGYARLDFDQYSNSLCGSKTRSAVESYWGVTKIGVTLVYIIK